MATHGKFSYVVGVIDFDLVLATALFWYLLLLLWYTVYSQTLLLLAAFTLPCTFLYVHLSVQAKFNRPLLEHRLCFLSSHSIMSL